MEKRRLSLFYLAGYLIPSGVALLIVPDFALKLLLSNSNYSEVFPRTAGMSLHQLRQNLGVDFTVPVSRF